MPSCEAARPRLIKSSIDKHMMVLIGYPDEPLNWKLDPNGRWQISIPVDYSN